MDDDFLQRLENEMSKIGVCFSGFGEGGGGGGGDDVSSSAEAESDFEDDGSVDGEVDGFGSLKMHHRATRNGLLDFKQLHILCFCFIGLVLVEEPVLVNDLLR